VLAAVAGLALLTAALMIAARGRPDLVGRTGRVAAFGLAWFFAATAPFAILADRLFIRYSYFGHAGLAIAAGGVVSGVVHWSRSADSPAAGPGSVLRAAVPEASA
jgi:hypothetical protein